MMSEMDTVPVMQLPGSTPFCSGSLSSTSRYEEGVEERQRRKMIIQEFRQALNKVQGITELLPVLEEYEVYEYRQLLTQEVRQISKLLNFLDAS